MKFRLVYPIFWVFIAFTASNCSKPHTEVAGANSPFSQNASAAGFLTKLYGDWNSANFSGADLSVLAGLSADELEPVDMDVNQYTAYYLGWLSQEQYGFEFWRLFYGFIGRADSVIAGTDTTTGLSVAVKTQVSGEAKFIRALCYFYLVNLYGDVPIITGTDTAVNRMLPRQPAADVWMQITADAADAQQKLSVNYLDTSLVNVTTERTRPTQWAADALLARIYLYEGKYDSAEAFATLVINHSTAFWLTALDSVFLKNSGEAIWQLPDVSGTGAIDASYFIPPGNAKVHIFMTLPSAFEVGDQRWVYWMDSAGVGTNKYFYPYKYKGVGEYEMVLRLAEQYLIRAEARTQQGNLAGALADLNMIRNRAGLPSYSGAANVSSLVSGIFRERRVELFTEWGHRWLDLKRSGGIDSVMNVADRLKGGQWDHYFVLYPLALADLQNDPALVQNIGY